MGISHEISKGLRKIGYDLVEFTPRSHPVARRKRLIEFYGIDTVLDVGANAGQFGRQLRRDLGFTGRILSFEPLSAAFERLKAKAGKDAAWEVFNFALGDTEERQEINISGNSYSSSLLDMLPAHAKVAPLSEYVGKETIEIRKLDSLFGDLCTAARNVYLKIDTQGFESKVLKGAEHSLARIDTVQMELSLVPLYRGELLFNDMCTLMGGKGYTLVAIQNGFTDRDSGQLLQVDGTFRRL